MAEKYENIENDPDLFALDDAPLGRVFTSEELASPVIDTSYLNLDDSVKHILLAADKPGQVLIVSEPFSLSWVALQIAAGILSAVGSRLFNSVLGSDFVSLNQDTINDIADHTRTVIQAEALRRALAHLESLQRLLREYLNSPDNMQLIETLRISSSDLLSECRSLGVPALKTYRVAAGLRLAILQIIYSRTEYDGDKRNFREAVTESMTASGGMMSAHISSIEAQFGELFGGPNGNPDEDDIWFYWHGNQRYERVCTLSEAESWRMKHILREIAKERIIVGGEEYRETTLKWVKARINLPKVSL